MSVFKFIAEILPGMGWLEPDGFHASASEQRTGGSKPLSKKMLGCSKELDGSIRLRWPRRRKVHDPVTVRLALGKSPPSGHLPHRLRQHSSFDQTLSVMELPMPQNAKSQALPEPPANEIGPDYSTLRAMRETRGYSVEKLSLTCGLAVDEIEDIENGRITDPSKLRRIASALRLPQEALITPSMPTPAAQGRSLA